MTFSQATFVYKMLPNVKTNQVTLPSTPTPALITHHLCNPHSQVNLSLQHQSVNQCTVLSNTATGCTKSRFPGYLQTADGPFKNIRAGNKHSSVSPSYSRHWETEAQSKSDSPTPQLKAESELSFLIHSPKLYPHLKINSS